MKEMVDEGNANNAAALCIKGDAVGSCSKGDTVASSSRMGHTAYACQSVVCCLGQATVVYRDAVACYRQTGMGAVTT